MHAHMSVQAHFLVCAVGAMRTGVLLCRSQVFVNGIAVSVGLTAGIGVGAWCFGIVIGWLVWPM